MGKVKIMRWTTKYPLQMIGECAGICWESEVANGYKNIKRAIECFSSEHGRTEELPDVYLVIEGYSARVIREWYTHIGGSPTRLQSSTRYVPADGFNYITPTTIKNNKKAKEVFDIAMEHARTGYKELLKCGIPKEDAAMVLPLGMETRIVDKRNVRNLIDMSRQRLCARAYWEYRQMFKDLMKELSDYSPEWKWIIDNFFYAKCERIHECHEKHGCGKFPFVENIPPLTLASIKEAFDIDNY